MLLKTSFLLPHLFCNVEFDFTWFHNNQTVVRDFNSQNRNAWVSRYWNYWVLINAFWIRLDLSDIDIWDIDLSDTDLDLLDKDIPSKHLFVSKKSSRCLEDSSSRRPQDISPRRLQDMSSRRLQRNIFSFSKTSSWPICKMSWKTKNCYAEDVLKTSSRHVLKTSSMFAGD